MSNWNIYIQSSGSNWVSDGTIPRANADLDITETSTQTEVQLADGSTAVLIPEITVKYQPLTFTWLEDDGTVKDKIRDYIDDNDYLKIVTHVGAEIYYGYFSNVQIVWLVGVADTFDIIATFRRVDGV
jgi:hypothetical protein